MSTSLQNLAPLIDTGVSGLDEVLGGGLVRGGMYLLEGTPGSGKTTVALQFLLAGQRRGERCLYVTLSESERELHTAAHSHGWSLAGIDILEILTSEDSLDDQVRYTMFHPSEVELAQTARTVLDAVDRIEPTLLVFDSLAELRLIAESPLRYRRQILALKQHFARAGRTVIFIEDRTGDYADMHLHSLASGVITLERLTVDYGPMRRRLQVAKLRSRAFAEGQHDFAIKRGGVEVYPRVTVPNAPNDRVHELVSSGLQHLDELLGGGISKGTSTLVVGPAGAGKSSLATQYVYAAVQRGERAVAFLFDEAIPTLLERSRGLGMDLQPLLATGRLQLHQVDPAQLSPGGFSHLVRESVQPGETSIVVIDSLNGYLNGMPSEQHLMLYVHDLLTHLGQQGVSSLLLLAQQGMVGNLTAPVDVSYLADTVILIRYFEAFGEIRQALSVMKKRTGQHERTLRQLKLNGRIEVGPPLAEFQGVLTGVPEYVGQRADVAAGAARQ
jgi:circadian clock protein KaiC